MKPGQKRVACCAPWAAMIEPVGMVDGLLGAAVPLDDRGLAYGDGVFETLLGVDERLVWWPQHLARLQQGAAALGIDCPGETQWLGDVERLLAGRPAKERCVLKLILTRGSGGRGYDPGAARPRRILSLHAAPSVAATGLRLHWCSLQLGAQPALAGFKHLNRLEQVLARAECTQQGCDEGLLCAVDGRVVSATAANLLVWRGAQWQTPEIRDCGVRGVCRAQLIDVLGARVCDLQRNDVLSAEAMFVCNSVRGIQPVLSLGGIERPAHPAVAAAQRRLAEFEPAFAAVAVPQ